MMRIITRIIISLLLMAWLVPLDAFAANTTGDVNNDSEVNIADVNAVIDIILSGGSDLSGDVNGDGEVNIADVNEVINIILGGTIPNPPETEAITVNGVSFNMVKVEGGTFTMGANDNDTEADYDERPAHQVTLSSFSIGQTEVTQALWQAVMADNPSSFSSRNGYSDNLNLPVENVSWDDCQAFITEMILLTGKTFRLPTEAEWEYAARGGNMSKGYQYAGSNNIDEVAWYNNTGDNIGDHTHDVATKTPNELGLYDMSGNVEEMCQDWYGEYSDEAQTNPTGPEWGYVHVIRGGNWNKGSNRCRVSCRNGIDPSIKTNTVGLRVILYKDEFDLSKSELTLRVGENKSVTILNGDGEYRVEGGEEFVASTINGNRLTVTGCQEGTTVVNVTNTSTGATATLTVNVKQAPVAVSETFTVNGVSFTMVEVEGGTFTMGATAEQGIAARKDEKPAHEVTLSSYSIGKTEVTQELWQAVMGSNPSYYIGNMNRPVECVSWDDCQTFITKLNELTGKTFRLPTEAEWEYAARGGNMSEGYRYAGSSNIDDVAWYSSISGSVTRPVATKDMNELGLYDMSGNVFEWCQDWYGAYSADAVTDPTGPEWGNYRVIRGGSWLNAATVCRVSCRGGEVQYGGIRYIGLRLAL
ncbi:MAG: SUMF1/EgtB/PvdO family nonheme iron enzyme [Muribaculaceae bacterium]|nr:SUMF1/EgtB/PvdO family nonheme iron enzyme [Muribaculaceae bacterium]